MRTFAAGVTLLTLFMLANLVAAGVIAVLMPLASNLADAEQLAAGLVIGILAIACALVFLRGALFYAAELAARAQRGFFVGRANPNKGLESAQGQRGGIGRPHGPN